MLAIALTKVPVAAAMINLGNSTAIKTALTKFVLKKSLSARFVAVFRP
jgi:hypothetical protein